MTTIKSPKQNLHIGPELIGKNRAHDEKTAKAYCTQVLEMCKRTHKKWEDPDFPATDASIFMRNGKRSDEDVKWKRLTELVDNPSVFVDGVEPGDVIQGSLGDCYFLGALSVVATRKDLLMPLFVAQYPEYGFFQIKFFKQGAWEVVSIDDRVPTMYNIPIYGHCKDPNEIWVPLVEKAYAKLHGCYEAIERGTISYALCDLTGAKCSNYGLNSEHKKLVMDGTLWNKMLYFQSEEYLLGCANTVNNGEVEKDNGMGILINHAYGILDFQEPQKGLKLVKIRNPWGKGEWKGAYSDNAPEWTPELKKKLNVTFEDDGIFWMKYEDFCQQYTTLNVVHLLEDQYGKVWHKYELESEWYDKTAGGCTNNTTWHNNPQFLITTNQPTNVFLSLTQPDLRLQWKFKYDCAIGMYLFKTSSPTRKVNYTLEEVLVNTSFQAVRDITCEAKLEGGTQYIFMPCTFQPNQNEVFWISIYSENALESVRLLPQDQIVSISGNWNGFTAGGCYNHPSWVNNPMFLLESTGPLSSSVNVSIFLSQDEKPNLYYIGFYANKWNGKKPNSTADIKHSYTCTNSPRIASQLTVSPDDLPLWIMPNTFDKNQQGNFVLSISSSASFRLRPI